MKLDPDLTIPGVTNDEFTQFINEQATFLHPSVRIGNSTLGGIGLIFSGEDISSVKDDLEILRIPPSSTFDYKKLLTVLEQLKIRDKNVNTELKESEFIVNLLIASSPRSETEIVQCYILAFVVFLKLYSSDQNSYLKSSPLRKYDTYLKVLLGTYTLGSSKIADSGISSLNRLALPYIHAESEFQSLCEEVNLNKFIDFDTYYQIKQAIKSRTLEIPYKVKEVEEEVEKVEEVDEEVENVEEVDEEAKNIEVVGTFEVEEQVNDDEVVKKVETLKVEKEVERVEEVTIEAKDNVEKVTEDLQNTTISDDNSPITKEKIDFHVNVTLVPILDFANHVYNNNSYFDVDLNTQDVILKIKSEYVKNSEFEVTINYDKIELIDNFITNYGFIPSLYGSDHYQLFNLEIDVEDDSFNRIKRWMGILSEVQLVYGGDDEEVYINLGDYPLLFARGLEYSDEWEREEGQDEDGVEYIKQLESECEAIEGISPVMIKYNGNDIGEDIEEFKNQLQIRDFEKIKAIESVIECANRYIPLLNPTDGESNFDIVTNEYKKLLKKILNKLILKDPRSLSVPESIYNEEWENYRRKPLVFNPWEE